MAEPLEFVPLQDFVSEDFGSTYVAGLRYTIKHGNDRLWEAAQVWEKRGLIRFIEVHEPAALRGAGKII
jgi:hypothetical protein